MEIMKGKLMGGTAVRLGFCLASLLFASTATADSIVVYSGYACLGVSTTGSQSGFSEGAGFGSFTRCPLTRINADDTTDITGIYVRVRDSSTTQAISCYAISCDATGATCSQGSSAATGTTTIGDQSLHIGSVSAYNTGYAYIHCNGASDAQNAIYSYRATD